MRDRYQLESEKGIEVTGMSWSELGLERLSCFLGFVVMSLGKKMKQQVENAKHQPVTIDGTSGTCTPTPPKIKLNALEDVRREMASVYREARAGRMDSSEAGRLAYILTGIGKLIEATEIEKRLAQMERKLLK